MQITEPYAIMH